MPYINFAQLEQIESSIGRDRFIHWQSAAHSHIGHVRDINEDAFLNASEQGLWVVADGMGGLARGDYASGVVVEGLLHFCRASSAAISIRDLEMRLRLAHDDCRNSFQGERVGSTVAAMFSYHDHAFFLWAGDSRIYRFRDGQLTQLTDDHTVAQERHRSGELSGLQARIHPSAHVLTRAVGVHQTLYLDLQYDRVLSGDRYLLCSDGLYQGGETKELEKALGSGDSTQSLQRLISLALEAGGRDNITAIVVDASDGP